MSAGYWSVLGVEATTDIAEIKRAYAARLKDCHPEDDPDGFQRLRAAYEAALRHATPRKPPRGHAMIDPKVIREQRAPARLDGDPVVVRELKPQAAEPPKAQPKPIVPEPPVVAKAEVKSPPETHEAKIPTVEPAKPEPVRVTKTEIAKPPETEEPKPETPKTQEPVTAKDDKPPPKKAEAKPVPPPVRPAPVPRPKPPVRVDPAAALQQEHNALVSTLWRLVITGGDAEAMRSALNDLLTSESMEALGTYARTEHWLADFIADNTPRSDPLVGPAIAHFGWRSDRIGRVRDASLRVVARSDDLVFLDGLRRWQSEHAEGWRALNAKPTRWRTVRYRINPTLARDVRAVLNLIHRERPGLIRDVDPDALAWWNQYFAEPQIPAAVGWVAGLLAVAPTFILPARGLLGPLPWALLFSALICFGGAAVLLYGCFYGVTRPRHRWLTTKHATAPMWARLGWAPAIVILVAAAALAPASLWVALGLAIVMLPLVYWVLITGQPNRNAGPRYPWWVRALFNFGYLAIFWLVMAAILPIEMWLQMSLPIAGGMIVFTWGAGSLYDAVRDEIGETALRGLRWFLAAVSALAFVTVLAVHDYPALEAGAAALIVVAVFTHKTLDGQLGPEVWRWRAIAMLIGWVAWFIVVEAAFGHQSHDQDFEIRLGLAVLTGPVIVAAAVLLAPLLARRRKPKLI